MPRYGNPCRRDSSTRGQTWNDNVKSRLEEILAGNEVHAVGEVGLDYHYNFSPRSVQRKIFRAQVKLAKKYNLPLICHLREAEEDFISIIKEEHLPDPPGVIHCYSSSPEYLDEFLSRGFYIGFTGIITFKKAGETRAALKQVPPASLLLETDSPYMAPVPYRGKRCEPSYVILIAQAAAELKNMSFHEIAKITTENLVKMLNI
ncbi:MAG: TatD family hydrolase [Candidatus Eremiobacteraeota bacterium]|nr:TatD family hydrolase [Candidatus Eremiobacteraeota bacterium]